MSLKDDGPMPFISQVMDNSAYTYASHALRIIQIKGQKTRAPLCLVYCNSSGIPDSQGTAV
jgi:hypothetical protein